MSTTPHESIEVESEPSIAHELFGSGIDQARELVTHLVEFGELLGLVGPQEYPRIWTRHVVNSVLLAPLLSGSVADVGSGAGLPGLPLAIARSDLQFTLIEPMERRASWLLDEVARLGLENVTVVRGRAEDVVDDVAVRCVTARAVAALSKLIPLTAPLAQSGGELLLFKGRGAEDEIAKAAKVIRKYRVSDVSVIELGVDLDTEGTRVVRGLVDADSTPIRRG